MPHIIALVPTNLATGGLGLPSRAAEALAGQTVLAHTLTRLSRAKQVREIVLVHPDDQNPLDALQGVRIKGLKTFAYPASYNDPGLRERRTARAIAPSTWRGGLGGATCYDELLPAGPLANACDKHKADAALLVGADWPLVDPDLCDRVIALHKSAPDAMKTTFTQAPPGLSGMVITRDLLAQFHDKGSTIGHLLAYNPDRPQADPIGRDVCVQIDAQVRGCTHRFVYDTARSVDLIRTIADHLGSDCANVDASQIVQTANDVWTADRAAAHLPAQVTLELTPQRRVRGPLLPQYYVDIKREPIDTAVALSIVEQLGREGDVTLTLGGLGDALLHPNWQTIARAAKDAGVLAVAFETDMTEDESVVDDLLTAPIDVLSVRLNADTPETWERLMLGAVSVAAPAFNAAGGIDITASLSGAMASGDTYSESQTNEPFAFSFGSDAHAAFDTQPVGDTATWNNVARNMQKLLEGRQAIMRQRGGLLGMPWIVPHLVKTADNLRDMESFFDRWMHLTWHAVIAPAQTGCGLMPDLSPVRMAPPLRRACRQIQHRMTIHSDGRVAQCDQDWLGRAPAGDATSQSLSDIWQSMQSLRDQHASGAWDENDLCSRCDEWHRP